MLKDRKYDLNDISENELYNNLTQNTHFSCYDSQNKCITIVYLSLTQSTNVGKNDIIASRGKKAVIPEPEQVLLDLPWECVSPVTTSHEEVIGIFYPTLNPGLRR